MWIVSGEKDGNWKELKTAFESRVDDLVAELENNGYGRITTKEV